MLRTDRPPEDALDDLAALLDARLAASVVHRNGAAGLVRMAGPLAGRSVALVNYE